jgi:hypothetical protein
MNEMTPTGRKAAHKRRHFKHHVNHPRDPWEVVIDVFLNSVSAAGKADFDIQTCLPTTTLRSDKNPQVQFDNCGRPGFLVKFRLFDNTNGGAGSGYRFPLIPEDGLWSQTGNSCPGGPAYEVFEQDSLDVVDKGLTLLASNPNPSPAQGPFRYTLNVSIGGTKPYTALDPGGNNMNGGWN